MISTTQDLPTQTATDIVGVFEVPRLVASIHKERVAFGLLYFPEDKVFRLAACLSEEVVDLAHPDDLSGLVEVAGFVAFPFNSTGIPGRFIPHRISFEELVAHPASSEENSRSYSDLEATPANHYISSVKEAVGSIQRGEFNKLVLSRHAQFPFDPDQLESFIRWVIERYPTANISVFNLPGQGLWIAASPEILLTYNKEEGIRSMALAGTRVYESGFDNVSLWSSKELEEQSIVSDFIRDAFQDKGIQKVKEKGPYSVQAGNLIHLRTDFFATDAHPDVFFELLGHLHPTTAVCGSPRPEAFDWISAHEDFDREFYAGFSGILEPEFRKMVVNLRTARIKNQTITLFAGAGITKASDPDKEWMETSEKLKTLGSFL